MPEPPIIPRTAFTMVVVLSRSNYLTTMPLRSIIFKGKGYIAKHQFVLRVFTIIAIPGYETPQPILDRRARCETRGTL